VRRGFGLRRAFSSIGLNFEGKWLLLELRMYSRKIDTDAALSLGDEK